MKFDDKINSIIAQYHDRMEHEEYYWNNLSMEEMMKREDEWLLAVGHDTGVFLNSLARSSGSKRILELGTSYGYSTIFLAEAARNNGGHVLSLEIHKEKAVYARQKIREAGLADFVEIGIGDALEILQNIQGDFDFVLLDIWKRFYLPCFELFYPKLRKGAWVIADNMLHPPDFKPEAMAYRKRIRETNAFDSVCLPIGSGIETSLLK